MVTQEEGDTMTRFAQPPAGTSLAMVGHNPTTPCRRPSVLLLTGSKFAARDPACHLVTNPSKQSPALEGGKMSACLSPSLGR